MTDFLPGRERVKRVDLEWPLVHEGREYREIFVKRLNAGEVAELMREIDAMREADPQGRVRWPIFVDADGALIPDAVMDGMDDDDKLAIDAVATDFLPRRFRPEAA